MIVIFQKNTQKLRYLRGCEFPLVDLLPPILYCFLFFLLYSLSLSLSLAFVVRENRSICHILIFGENENKHMGEMKRPKGQRKRESDRWGPSSSNNRNWSHGKPPRFSDEKAEMHWEQKFCQMNGVSWAKVLETKEFVHQYSDITSWNDSAGKEAFENAKARYWAQINGFQPNTPLPDPDMLIDNIDHDAPPSDLKLYQNLHGSLSEDEGDNSTDDYWITDVWGEGGVILWDSHYAKEEEVVWGDMPTGWGENQPIIPTGWGDIPVQSSVQPDTWGGVMHTSWASNSVNPIGWDYMAASGNPPDNWGNVQTSWANNSVNPTGWEQVTADVNPVTTYGGIVPTGWGEVEEGPGNTWTGYDCGVSGEAGQYWNYSSNYCNGDGFNGGNWGNSNQNWNSNGAGGSGWNKSENRNYNKGKQWKKKEDRSGHFCAPLNESANGWNAPWSVV